MRPAVKQALDRMLKALANYQPPAKTKAGKKKVAKKSKK